MRGGFCFLHPCTSPQELSPRRSPSLAVPSPPGQRNHFREKPVLVARAGGFSGLSQSLGRRRVSLSVGVFAIRGQGICGMSVQLPGRYQRGLSSLARGPGGIFHSGGVFHDVLTTTERSSYYFAHFTDAETVSEKGTPNPGFAWKSLHDLGKVTGRPGLRERGP